MITPGHPSGVHATPYLALAPALQLERAVVAVRIVAGLAEERVSRPGAAAQALLGVVAAAAEPVQVVDRPIAREAQGGRPLPDFLRRVLAQVAADVGARGKRRTPP